MLSWTRCRLSSGEDDTQSRARNFQNYRNTNAQIDSVARRKPEADGISPESNENVCGFSQSDAWMNRHVWDPHLVCWRLETTIIQYYGRKIIPIGSKF
jgi:hypothetical protein